VLIGRALIVVDGPVETRSRWTDWNEPQCLAAERTNPTNFCHIMNKEATMADTAPPRRRNGAISTSPYIQNDSRLRAKYLHDRRIEDAALESRATEISRHNRLVLAL